MAYPHDIPTEMVKFWLGNSSRLLLLNYTYIFMVCSSGWWFGTCFIFPYNIYIYIHMCIYIYILGIIIPTDFHIFQRASAQNHHCSHASSFASCAFFPGASSFDLAEAHANSHHEICSAVGSLGVCTADHPWQEMN